MVDCNEIHSHHPFNTCALAICKTGIVRNWYLFQNYLSVANNKHLNSVLLSFINLYDMKENDWFHATLSLSKS